MLLNYEYIYIYIYIYIYRFRLSQTLAQHRTSTLAMLNRRFQLLNLVTRKHLTKNWFLLTMLGCVAYVLTFCYDPSCVNAVIKTKTRRTQ